MAPLRIAAAVPHDNAFSSCSQAALTYASLGWRVIPVKGKRPAIRDWPGKASNDPGTINSWFGNYTGVGIVTGSKSGIVALDIDPRNGGNENLQALEIELGKLPRTVTAQTGGGGRHFLFHWFPGNKNHKPAPGIDFQCSDGQMIVAAPSVHPESGIKYRWLHPPEKHNIAHLPEAWQEFLSVNRSPASPSVTQRASAPPDNEKALFIDPIPEGARNTTLFNLGVTLRARHQRSSLVSAAVHEANLRRCQPPLPDEEVLRIVENVLNSSIKGKSVKTLWQESVLRAPGINDATIRVAFGLSMYADADGGSCFPNQAQLAHSIAKSPNTVRKHIEELEKQGWIKRYKHARDGQGFSYGYILTLKETQN